MIRIVHSLLFNISILACILASSLVISQQICVPAIPSSSPEVHFFSDDIGLVYDSRTQLTWHRCFLGQSWGGKNDNTCIGRLLLVNWEDAQKLASLNEEWRLPNIKEVTSIIDLQCADPAVNLEIFPFNSSVRLWSSSPHVSFLDRAWSVDLLDGAASPYGRQELAAVILISDPNEMSGTEKVLNYPKVEFEFMLNH